MEGILHPSKDEADSDAMDYRTRLLLVLYGPSSLSLLLRLKLTYPTIEGLVVYDETFSISIWLQEHGHLDS